MLTAQAAKENYINHNLRSILQTIYNASMQGSDSLILKKDILTERQETILKELGYKVFRYETNDEILWVSHG